MKISIYIIFNGNTKDYEFAIKVSSNPKIGGINKWKYFINASNKHPQISLILLNLFFSYNIYNNFCR